jgi:hypothetical protein
MAAFLDKRRRNARPSKYRPRTEAQKQQRRDLWEARSDERKVRRAETEEERLMARLAALETALRDVGQEGVHRRRHSRPLDDITDDAERFTVLKARVERLEALWSIDRRRRETRGKIIIGGALLAELVDATAAGDTGFLASLLDILDRRVEAARDRLTVRELLGGAPLPLRSGEKTGDGYDTGPGSVFRHAPDFDAMVQSAMAEETLIQPSEIDTDDADLDPEWRVHA